jgi:hypothetical protein
LKWANEGKNEERQEKGSKKYIETLEKNEGGGKVDDFLKIRQETIRKKLEKEHSS